MKKRGFTLIELLAVIVVLAVVALIAFPIIAGIIEKTKRSAAYRSVEGYVEAANNAAILYDLDNNKGINITEAKHTFTSSSDTEELSKIKAKGTLPTYSYLDFDINKKVVTEGHFCINGYSVLYSEGTAKASETKYCEEGNQGGNGSGNNDNLPNENTNSQDNGACTDEKILSTANIRYNPETKYIQVLSGATWVNAMYFDAEWDGTVYSLGSYSKTYFDEFSGSSYSFRDADIYSGYDRWTNLREDLVYNSFIASKVGINVVDGTKQLHILFDAQTLSGTNATYQYLPETRTTQVRFTLSADGVTPITKTPYSYTSYSTGNYGVKNSVTNVQVDFPLTEFVGKDLKITETLFVSKSPSDDSWGQGVRCQIKKIWIS